jgi:hypothetical protein
MGKEKERGKNSSLLLIMILLQYLAGGKFIIIEPPVGSLDTLQTFAG